MDIPVVDISSSNPDAPAQLLDAAIRYGFVYIENDNSIIQTADISRMLALSKEFFDSPIEVKQAVAIASNKAGKNHGWLSQGVEKLDPATQKRADVKEAFNIGQPLPNTTTLQQPLPTPLQPHAQTILSFQTSCHAFCQALLTQFARALHLEDENWFTARHDRSKGPSGTNLRLLYYPRISDDVDKDDLRAGAHSDFGSLTLLFQLPGQPGLEIQTADGKWVGVPVDPRALPTSNGTDEGNSQSVPILVNIGDLLEDWTDGLLKSTVHRVVFPTGSDGGDRYSIAYFCQPLDDATLDPVPSEIVREHAARTGRGSLRSGMTAKDHLMERLAATYSIKQN